MPENNNLFNPSSETGVITEIADRIISITTGDYDIYTTTLEMNAGGSVILIGTENGISFEGDPEDPPAEKNDDKPATCDECGKEITITQIKSICGGTLAQKGQTDKEAEEKVNKILFYLNKYREKYKLDTCIRKAQFIAQALAETDNFHSLAEVDDSLHYTATTILKTFNDTIRFYTNALLKDYFVKPADDVKKCYGYFTDEQLTTMIKLEYSKDYKSEKFDLKELLKTSPYDAITVNQAALYGKNKAEILYEDNNLTITLKEHASHDVQTLSRAYADRPGELDNGDELSKDGYKFMGKGILQLTGRSSYLHFTKYRNKGCRENVSQFIDDDPNKPYLDFTKDDSGSTATKPTGPYNKLADSENPIYAVQSAVWEWAIDKQALFTGSSFADNDDIEGVSKKVNGGYNGLTSRCENIKRARKGDAFNVYSHYESIYNNGTEKDKKVVIKNLLLINKDRYQKDQTTKKMVNLKDDNKEAKDLLDKLQKIEAEKKSEEQKRKKKEEEKKSK